MQGLFETFCHHFGDVEPVTTSDLIGPTRKAMLCFLAGEIALFHKPQAYDQPSSDILSIKNQT